MSDVKACAEENSSNSTPSDIIICDEEQTKIPSDIKVCLDDGRLDPDPCSVATEVFVVGDGDCNVGDVYGAVGGVQPYTFGFSGGSIDSTTGEILSITACGAPGSDRSGTVSVTDDCGQGGSLVVRLFGGEWGPDDTTPTLPPGNDFFGTCTFFTCNLYPGTINFYDGGTLIEDGTRTSYRFWCCTPDEFDCGEEVPFDPIGSLTCDDVGPDGKTSYLARTIVSMWVCP